MEMSAALKKVLQRQCGENTLGMLYIGQKVSEKKRCGENSSGFTDKQSSQGGAFSENCF